MKNRPERKISFLVVWLTMFSCISGMGQNFLKKEGLSPDFKHLWMPGTKAEVGAINARMWGLHSHLDFSWGVVLTETATTKQQYVIHPDYYAQTGFFCRKEWELEKATHIPFRFRLGSLAELDAMEGKH